MARAGPPDGPSRVGPSGFAPELHADEPMPAAIGWHPWFRRHLVGPDGRRGPVAIEVAPAMMYEHGTDGLPTGRLVAPKPPPWDDCFVELAGPVRLRWPGADGSGIELRRVGLSMLGPLRQGTPGDLRGAVDGASRLAEPPSTAGRPPR